MKIFKGYVRNRARPEGSIAECYLAEECMAFCSQFLKHSIEVDIQEVLEDFGNEVILEGRPISGKRLITLSDELLEIAHRCVLFNTAEVEPFLE